MLSGLFTSTLMQQAVRYEVITAESHNAEDIATVDRATTFSAYDGNQLVIGKLYLAQTWRNRAETDSHSPV